MSIMRVNKNKNYTTMSNVHLRDRSLSLKAKGLLSVVLSLPDDWHYSISGLVAICKESETSVKSAIEELKDHHYLTVERILPNKDNNGRFEYVYTFYENPQEETPLGKKQGTENLPIEILPIENLSVENVPANKILIEENKEEENTDRSITDDNNSKTKSKNKRFVPPTLEEVTDYCIERNNGINPEAFIDYYTARGWMLNKQKMKDWKAAVRTWERNDFNMPKPTEKPYNPFDDENL